MSEVQNGQHSPIRYRQGNPVGQLILRRILLGFALLVAASMLIYGGVEALPGDFASIYLGQEATPEAVANIREELGLERPLVQRYLGWLGGVIKGDFGTSWSNRNSIGEQIGKRLANSLLLAGVSAAIAIPLALSLGLIAVRYRNRVPDRTISILSLAAVSLPEFFIGYLLIQLFTVKFGVGAFPSTVYDGMGFGERLFAIALPVLSLVVAVLAHMMRMTRSAILNVMSSPYVETAELKGLSALRIIAEHAAPNAAAPIVTVIALNLAALVVGVIVIEVVFVYPGIGQYMVDAVTMRDMPVVQACGLIFAALYIVLNLMADIVSILANPRLRHPR
ncbi:hypothetical protein N182_27885 [Sinorhizobium sp. GL2]|nr:hypothetical protein N182_27885 [Sinorhizobium sp. GL2]